ncbi:MULTISPECIES: cbb3-type cytochrome oxidase assembly protein CcoS [Sulfurimonas]|uniref:cbb3-type cytochrome oxidase assembly protein CcoS n=1 Tax=Sulfurimonas TaxID=202746 RepID=UPI001265503C|nr:cbb3-type cytochrome oxidase assembly protein CcoS [Sulfurimonas indica]
MDSWVIGMMLGVSVFLGSIAVVALMWAIKKGQFDDKEKFLNSALFDDVDELNDAARAQAKKKEALRKKEYRPE